MKTKFSFLLNPDATIELESIKNLLKIFEYNEKIAIASSIDAKTLKPSKEIIERLITHHRKNYKVFEENDKYLLTNFSSGCYMMLRMEIFRKIGFFDENIFLYGEDDEICHRSISSGYFNAICKSSFVNHLSFKATKTNSKFEEIALLYKRNWHSGWSKSYLQRKKKSYLIILLRAFYRLLKSPIYHQKKGNLFIKRFAIALGSISNLIGIDCFNKNNRVPKITKIVEI